MAPRCLAPTCALIVLLAALAMPAVASAKAGPCTAAGPVGSCGPYDYPGITHSWDNTTVALNGWNCGSPPGCGPLRETVTSPGRFTVSADEPTGNTAVMMYPSLYQVWWNSARGGLVEHKITAMREVRSKFTEAMRPRAGTVAWAAYDMFIDHPGTSHNEMMVQTQNVGGCISCSPVAGHATFGGQAWTLHTDGGEMIWDLTRGDHERSGTVRLLAMLRWLQSHRFIGKSAAFSSVGFGWEVCSTGGQAERFSVSRFTLALKHA